VIRASHALPQPHVTWCHYKRDPRALTECCIGVCQLIRPEIYVVNAVVVALPWILKGS